MPECSVVIPVGPNEANRRWLNKAIASCWTQTVSPSEVILIDDGANLDKFYEIDCKVWKAPWRLGVAHAFNMGVGLSETECVFMLGSDDTLEVECLEKCLHKYQHEHRTMGYYGVCVRYMSDGRLQNIACNAAMVTKDLWAYTGGFPVESAVGSPDAALLSILLKHRPKLIKLVAENVPLYNYNDHAETETMTRNSAWEDIIIAVRNRVTERWHDLA